MTLPIVCADPGDLRPHYPGIYSITSRLTGVQYVGSASDIATRWRKHYYSLKRGKHHSLYLQRSWNAHGPQAFIFAVIERVERGSRLLERLLAREQHYLDTLRPGFNCAPTAGSSLGVKHSAEMREKVRQANLGRKMSLEARLRMSQARKGRKAWNKGIPCPEHVKAINAARRGEKRPQTSASLMGHRGWNKGRTYGPEVRAKVSAAGKGRPKSDEHKRKIAEANRGKPHPWTAEHNRSSEHRAKVSAAQKGRKNPWNAERNCSPEMRAKIQAAWARKRAERAAQAAAAMPLIQSHLFGD